MTVLMHHFEKKDLAFRDCVLSSLQLVNYLKPGENAGFYIDSQEPFYNFKIELNNQGTFRTLILPKDSVKIQVLLQSGKTH